MDRNENRIEVTVNWAELLETVNQAALFETIRKLYMALPSYAFEDALEALLGKRPETEVEE